MVLETITWEFTTRKKRQTGLSSPNKQVQIWLSFLRRLRSFHVCITMLRMFYQSVVFIALSSAAMCWGRGNSNGWRGGRCAHCRAWTIRRKSFLPVATVNSSPSPREVLTQPLYWVCLSSGWLASQLCSLWDIIGRMGHMHSYRRICSASVIGRGPWLICNQVLRPGSCFWSFGQEHTTAIFLSLMSKVHPKSEALEGGFAYSSTQYVCEYVKKTKVDLDTSMTLDLVTCKLQLKNLV